MNRIEREKQTVQRMIELYCHHHLKVETMPEEYKHLAEFACRRLDHCKYGENKTACKNCPTHCYASKMLLPISVTAKGILWTVLFGLAKTCQYGGLTILGVEGYKRLKNKFKRNKQQA